MTGFSWTDPAVLAFVVIPAFLVVGLIAGVAWASRRLGESDRTRRRVVLLTTAGAIVWMAATWLVAVSGVLREWDATPPPFALLVVGIVLLAALIASGGYGRRLALGVPLWTLIGIQAFRLPLELAMHAMYERGIMPAQMSYSGRNFDIVTGVTALMISALVRTGRAGRALVLGWNILGLALLLNVVTVAILSTPRIRYFGDDALNVWVTYPPFVWLPAVMVQAALAGHLLIFRAVQKLT